MNRNELKQLVEELLAEAIVSGENLEAVKDGYRLRIRNRHVFVYDKDDDIVYEEPFDPDALGDSPHTTFAVAGFAPSLTLNAPIDTFRKDVENAIVRNVATVLDIVIFTKDGRLFWTATVNAIPDDDFSVVIKVTNNGTGNTLMRWNFIPADEMPDVWWKNAMYNAGMIEW